MKSATRSRDSIGKLRQQTLGPDLYPYPFLTRCKSLSHGKEDKNSVVNLFLELASLFIESHRVPFQSINRDNHTYFSPPQLMAPSVEEACASKSFIFKQNFRHKAYTLFIYCVYWHRFCFMSLNCC